MELIQEPTEAPPRPLIDEIADIIEGSPDGAKVLAGKIMELMMDRGHYLPGAPPASQILDDARSFAERLIMSNLALRLNRMLTSASLHTPEKAGATRWLNDYLDGRNHGPVGKPMLWPRRLPGIASLLRQWGFMPTPTNPEFVARDLGLAAVTVQ